jgi:hypothetical protein
VKRFDCPSCAKSLRFRLLPQVPGGRNGELAFSCIHCRAVLGYNKGPLDVLLWGTRLRSLATMLAGWALLSAFSLAVGLVATFGVVAALAVALIAHHTLSARPAYKVVGPANPPG